jgi:hypothetical protein
MDVPPPACSDPVALIDTGVPTVDAVAADAIAAG